MVIIVLFFDIIIGKKKSIIIVNVKIIELIGLICLFWIDIID